MLRMAKGRLQSFRDSGETLTHGCTVQAQPCFEEVRKQVEEDKIHLDNFSRGVYMNEENSLLQDKQTLEQTFGRDQKDNVQIVIVDDDDERTDAAAAAVVVAVVVAVGAVGAADVDVELGVDDDVVGFVKVVAVVVAAVDDVFVAVVGGYEVEEEVLAVVVSVAGFAVAAVVVNGVMGVVVVVVVVKAHGSFDVLEVVLGSTHLGNHRF